MDAAEPLILDQGFAASFVDAIVKRAGVTKGTFSQVRRGPGLREVSGMGTGSEVREAEGPRRGGDA
jgi:hypothetical protein